tara:strand:- start:667 stop:1095 length:429 start_codon:yes stop_codon:yes gene_type:complete
MKAMTKKILMLLAVAVLMYVILSQQEGYTPRLDSRGSYGVAGPSAGPSKAPECQMKAGSGLASSLLPREIASDEDFGEFAPQDILRGQNFLSPRDAIGFPETVGGSLRNANQQVRNEMANPKDVFVWQNSTIVPDTARRPLE